MANILIIDDRPLNRQFLTTLLGYQRHELHEAADGAEGLLIARAVRPDLIISDVLMPTMDGYEFVRRLRLDPVIGKTPVIFSTAHYLSRESKALAEKCGVNFVIYKPCEPALVLETVASVLAGRLQPDAVLPEPEEFKREHLELLTDKVAEKSEELRDANNKLGALIQLSTDLGNEYDPAELLDRYGAVARQLVGASWTLVALIAGDPQTVAHLGAAGIDLPDRAALQTALPGTGIFKTVIDEGRTICLRESEAIPASLQLPAGFPPVTSLLVAPLNMRGNIYGWLCLADKLGFAAFSEQDERLALALAAKMAIAYDNAQLFSQTRKYAAKLEAEISERARIQRELSESRARLAGIIGSAMDAIITIDSGQRVVLFNEAAEQMLRCEASAAIGVSLDRFIPARVRTSHAEDVRTFGATDVSSRAMGAARSLTGLRGDGEEFPMEASISQAEVAGQKLYTVIIRDITERQRAQQELQAANQHLEQTLNELWTKNEALTATTQQLWQASKLATMGELAASIAHELNNPLATVGLRTEALLLALPPDSDKRKSLKIIAQEVDRMARLVNNLLQFSRRNQREISTLDPRAEIADSVEFINYHLRSHNIEVVSEFADNLPTIQADRQQLRQLFLNLSTNASDAMPRGGKLTVRATSESASHSVAIEFSDNGEGITAENLARIWEPFFTTKPEGKGTGLGLAICRRIVEEHSGSIAVASQAGKGTTVRIILPATNGVVPTLADTGGDREGSNG